MKIAIDALGIHYFGGGRTATLCLLENLFSIDHSNQYVVALSQPEPSLNTPVGNVHQWIVPIKNRFLSRLWAQVYFPIKFRDFDIVHFIKNIGVFGLRPKTVITMFDLTTLVYPELFPKIDVLYWQTIQKYVLKTSDKIISISENTARDMEKYFQIPQDKIQVIYPAHADHFKIPSQAEIDRVTKKYELPEKFIVHVGRIDRKKNLSLLIQAFATLLEEVNFEGRLVFVGEEYRKSQDTSIYALIDKLNLDSYVQFTGPVPDDDLAAIYGAALASVYCSLHEGFGIVALETMACGTPLIVTPAGAILEAVGDAAKIVPLDRPDILANYLKEIIIMVLLCTQ